MKKTEKKCSWHYEGDIEHVECCVICHSSKFEKDSNFEEKLGLIEPFGCKKCLECGLRWLSPRPTQKGYQSIYTTNNYLGGEHSPEIFSSVEKKRELLFRDRLEKIERYLASKNTKKSILDIGAATGQFVHEAMRNGYRAVGIELSEDARKECRKKYAIDLYDYTLDDLCSQGRKFDAIHMNHVFEHILHPDKCLDACHDLLKKEGIMVIEVPQQFFNDLDRLKFILGKIKSPSFNPYSLHHTYFYTPKTINRILNNHGFSIKSLRTSNFANTPLFPFSLKFFSLGIYLLISDRIHYGGNIIEIFAKKNDSN